MTVSVDQPVSICPHVHAREFDGELVVLDLTRGDYFGLDAIGARVWAELVRGRCARQIASQLAPDYRVEPERLLADIGALIDELVRRGLVAVVSEVKGTPT
jgi:hypothetical protein